MAAEEAERAALEAEKKKEGDFDTTFRQVDDGDAALLIVQTAWPSEYGMKHRLRPGACFYRLLAAPTPTFLCATPELPSGSEQRPH